MALANAGMLARYFAGIPTHPRAAPVLLRLFMPRPLRRYAIAIPPEKVCHCFTQTIVRRVTRAMLPANRAIDWSLRGNALFERAIAPQMAALEPDAVVCYELTALETFRLARRRGIITVLDAASVHHSWQDRFLAPVESKALHDRMIRRKAAEIELADHILTVSELARQSYVDSGTPESRVTSIPLGVDVDVFRPRSKSAGNSTESVRFIFVGNISRLKGVDVLDKACRVLRQRVARFTLTIVTSSPRRRLAGQLGDAKVIGPLSHKELAQELRCHDVLVLPSRFDSFGLVVAEAMASGLPTIVTENVGGKEMIINGESGAIVAVNDAEALASAMQWFIDNRQQIPTMAKNARAAAERYAWSHYREHVVRFFERLPQ